MTKFPRSIKQFGPSQLFIASIVMLAMAFALLVAAVFLQSRPPRVSLPTTPIALGQPINMGAATMTVHGVSYPAGRPPFTAPAGQRFAVVDFSVANRSDAPVIVTPSSDTYLKDSDGRVYYLSAYQLEHPFRPGQLLPGEQIRGELSYLIPSNSSPNFYVDAIWSGGTVPFMLKP